MNFKEIAKKETTLSRVMENRTKVTTEDIMTKYPNGVTVTEFDFINGTDTNGNPTSFPVLAIAEDNSICFFGGAVLDKICLAWVEANGGDIDGTSEELKRSGGVKIAFRKTKTRKGNTLTAVDIL